MQLGRETAMDNVTQEEVKREIENNMAIDTYIDNDDTFGGLRLACRLCNKKITGIQGQNVSRIHYDLVAYRDGDFKFHIVEDDYKDGYKEVVSLNCGHVLGDVDHTIVIYILRILHETT